MIRCPNCGQELPDTPQGLGRHLINCWNCSKKLSIKNTVEGTTIKADLRITTWRVPYG